MVLNCDKMAEKECIWTNLETRALLEICSVEEIQWEILRAVCNDLSFSRIVTELARHGYKRTVDQCRVKIKALKMKYKQITDKLEQRWERIRQGIPRIVGVSLLCVVEQSFKKKSWCHTCKPTGF